MTDFQVAINRNYTDKVKPGDGRFWDFNMTFENGRLLLSAFVEAINSGHAWTAPHAELSRLGCSTGEVILLINQLVAYSVTVFIIKQNLCLGDNPQDITSKIMVTFCGN